MARLAILLEDRQNVPRERDGRVGGADADRPEGACRARDNGSRSDHEKQGDREPVPIFTSRPKRAIRGYRNRSGRGGQQGVDMSRNETALAVSGCLDRRVSGPCCRGPRTLRPLPARKSSLTDYSRSDLEPRRACASLAGVQGQGTRPDPGARRAGGGESAGALPRQRCTRARDRLRSELAGPMERSFLHDRQRRPCRRGL